jgi:hypothetical protein
MRALFVLGGLAVGAGLVYIAVKRVRYACASAREEMFIQLGSRVIRTLPS